ncbi:ribonuclease D [Streptoalloteichus tenebrarius]|uniref:Ribonuclease D n=1 Tax=Streptoalloteichus tenebrarius (strain ATCC 17920 / DSM 40477 / JCM 4838 / CBS 697.72 / NBRC 16177 / NCIMB 11028 / NRRL B-12390 / A12253. 1 / ISP 5477) TaxID=1933 RepID=A0ABT1HS38_STRSD|nr:ribonuclease D [Streptoalloteichus tenebrarius]MCP2258307.1 ribonuclease D [Streptoalloteichus tenebrarius]BFF03471.1 ribonuclease D [Streptoalloteichus tenebrarius]
MDAPYADPTGPTGSEPVPLTEPAEGVPPVVADPAALRRAAEALASATGPVAVDTERASGYRYSQRAYLVQLRRDGAGTVLVDPIALGGRLEPLVEALADTEWVLHAASQDLPCLAELDLRPTTLFDTELAGRLAGFDRVALGALVERLLGYRLEKGHGAADWSRRPLPADWLTYAALDVELLIPLRRALEEELTAQGKLDWALQEFEAVRTAPLPQPRSEPWRRTSGIHRLRNPRQLAAVRALWEARDAIARERDIAPGRVLPDSAIVDAVVASPEGVTELLKLPVYRGRAQRRLAGVWMGALERARRLSRRELPEVSPANDGPPPPNRWADRDPAAAARLTAARAALSELATEHRLPVENLLSPDLVRRTCWQPPEDVSPDGVASTLRAGGARLWQVELTSERLSTALQAKPA